MEGIPYAADLILDSIAEVAAFEDFETANLLISGIESVIIALCIDIGMPQQDVSAELHRRTMERARNSQA